MAESEWLKIYLPECNERTLPLDMANPQVLMILYLLYQVLTHTNLSMFVILQ